MIKNPEDSKGKGSDKKLKNPNEQVLISTGSSYFSEASQYYNTIIDQYKSGTQSKENYELVDYFETSKRALQELSREKNRAQPEEVATALLYLGAKLATDNPFRNKEMSKYEQDYFKSKDLFMKGCQKMYPGISIGNLNISQDFTQLFSNFNQLPPMEQLEMIGVTMEALVPMHSEVAWNVWRGESNTSPEELATWAQEAYKLQLLRDKIQKEVYGNADISSQDAAKIDGLRKELLPKKENPVYEKVTAENLDNYIKQKKSVLLNGEIYKVENVGKDGSVFVERSISIKEALALAEKVTKVQDSSTNINSGFAKSKMFSVPKEGFIKDAQWMTQSPRSADNPQRQVEVREAQELQTRIASGEFDKNYGGSLSLLLDVFEKEAKRLNEEKEAYSGK